LIEKKFNSAKHLKVFEAKIKLIQRCNIKHCGRHMCHQSLKESSI